MHQHQFMPASAGYALRSAEIKDATALTRLMGDSESALNYGCPRFASTDWWDQRVRRALEFGRMFVAADGDRILGLVTIEADLANWSRRHAGMLGLCVDQTVRQRGIGRRLCALAIDEADQLALDRLELYVWEDNLAAISLYQSLGFEREGVHRCFGLRGGHLTTAWSMCRLRSDAEPFTA